MTDQELVRALRILRRTVDMLRTELRHGRIDEGLLHDIEAQMERGIHLSIEPGGATRSSYLTTLFKRAPRLERHADTAHCPPLSAEQPYHPAQPVMLRSNGNE